MSDLMTRAVADVAEVMKFENWLRFYFVKEEEGEAVRIEIPAEIMEHLKKTQEHLAGLAEQYNGELVDYQKSCTDTCAHVALVYDGNKYPPGTVTSVWDTKALKLEMYLFGLWMQGHEAQLDEEFMDFPAWLSGFEQWKNTAEVQDYLDRLTDVGQRANQ
ncbi:hypothetical protein [Desulfocurvus vexinensis]|uniref:hypothetical protein n=1 Tax=Desulfocurvus vexinensis TaxID=399548 RepID=UPI00048ACFD5|nr:hypothetical protein [Desulfocurvus vexinensis]